MKILHLGIIILALITGIGIIFSPSSNAQMQNNSTDLKCMDNMTQDEKKKYASFDEEQAKTAAINYDKFKSEIKDDKYMFRAVSQEWTNDQVNCTATLKDVLVLFFVTDSSGKQRDVTVIIDPTSYMPQGIDVKYDVATHGGIESIATNQIDSPLKQFRSGTLAQDVKCSDGLSLVIKSEDGSPACVKPEHLTRLSQYGWTIPNLKIIGDTDITQNGLSESNCGQFHTIPENKSNSNEIPVLILKQNSTGCAKITFTVNFLFNNTNDCVGCDSQMVKTAEFLSIGKYNFSRHGDLISGSSGKDYTNSFQIASVPKTVDVSKYPIGSNFTAVFIIKPLPNATGFYDYSIVKPVCNAYPLAVGYSPDQVNSSDFSEGLSFMQNHPCVMGSFGYSQIQVSGIDYVQMKLD